EAPATARDRRLALAAARGQVVHHVLEDGVHADPAAIRTRWAAAARAVAATADELDQGLIRVEAHVAATIDASEVRRALAAPGWSELPFRATHAGVALRGRIDRLWFDAEAGGHVVLDWKSDALLGRPPDTVADTHAVQVAGYAWAADRVLVARGAPGVVRTEIVLTERGVVVARPWTDADRARIPDLLERAADTTARPWDDVERDAIRAPRPCASCGFRGFGCRGSAHGDEG
ncbi:MAG: PD-(D/E)XK nuclease family protein, partial [Myxococcota bacterium]